jgi:thiamine pyrophosphate-dependent acetolactate synthase large subunit-like protein
LRLGIPTATTALESGNVVDLHPVYTAMAQAREAAEANGAAPVDVVWNPA